jgi:hypothetical protein
MNEEEASGKRLGASGEQLNLWEAAERWLPSQQTERCMMAGRDRDGAAMAAVGAWVS